MEDRSYIQVAPSQKVIAGYALQQKLGSGSFAVVYRGVRVDTTSSGRNDNDDENNPTLSPATAAIKAIARDRLTAKVLQNLELEIAILRQYRHRHIVCLHAVHKTERHFYLVLEYCGGGDVQQLIRTRRARRLTEPLCRRLLRDLSAGLQFLWSQELIHRDIKPQNLLLTGPLPVDEIHDVEATDEMEAARQRANFPTAQFCLKIADFGFARHLTTASLAETLCGSPLYMAPEILQHHRYDAKADLWSVGTVLFEMIAGRPPFHGENHIDLLRNIQRKAVRLPPDVRVSQECVNLLRLLLNRNPLARAGFKEFFEACNAFVALGCQGTFVADEGTCHKPVTTELGTIPERPASTSPPQPPVQPMPMETLLPTPTLAIPQPSTAVTRTQTNRTLEPLVPSPPITGMSPIQVATGRSRHNSVEIVQRKDSSNTTSPHGSTGENSFVMVEHGTGSYPKGESLSRTPPATGYLVSKTGATVRDYLVPLKPSASKGMLSTSPGTGGALMMGLIQRRRLLSDNTATAVTNKQVEAQILNVTKMLAASEDVGRRAISVAHLGDNRAYLAMHMTVLLNEGSSSLLSASPMEGIEEADDERGNVTDDEELIVRRRRLSSVDKSMHDVKEEEEEEADEMPFAIQSEAPPVMAAGMPSRSSNSFTKGYSITSSKPMIKPTPAMIHAHFQEALRCYLKTLQMLKGALGATQRVKKEADMLMSQGLSPSHLENLQNVQKRYETTSKWLNDQFRGVLERADAANGEITKATAANQQQEKSEKEEGLIVEELIYNHALNCGREGAVKQLLGQFDAARACYRSAGLLAETLLMEQNVSSEDRKVLEEYVDGFAARITELDDYMAQSSSVVNKRSVMAGGSRSPAVVSLVAQAPMKGSGVNLASRPFP